MLLDHRRALTALSGRQTQAGTELVQRLVRERRVRDPREVATAAAVDERGLAAHVRALALRAVVPRRLQEPLRGPAEGVLGSQPDHPIHGQGAIVHRERSWTERWRTPPERALTGPGTPCPRPPAGSGARPAARRRRAGAGSPACES